MRSCYLVKMRLPEEYGWNICRRLHFFRSVLNKFQNSNNRKTTSRGIFDNQTRLGESNANRLIDIGKLEVRLLPIDLLWAGVHLHYQRIFDKVLPILCQPILTLVRNHFSARLNTQPTEREYKMIGYNTVNRFTPHKFRVIDQGSDGEHLCQTTAELVFNWGLA